VLLSGGETTVTVRGSGRGRGGCNAEWLLSPGIALDGHPGIHAHGFFGRLGDAVITGATPTNVDDFRAVRVGSPAGAGRK
jgi:hydroxypyruvate reductase